MSNRKTIWKNRLFILLALLVLPFVASQVHAQATKGVITGTVVDNAGATLKGARLELLPLKLVGVSNPQGEFILSDVPAGSYTLSISFVGFKSTQTKVDVVVGQTKTLEIKLEVASASENVIVSAERVLGEADAINETRMADNLIQVLPAEVITSLPNANAADAIGRLPSVTLYRIEGEGVYIQVRGTEPRLTNVTVDGITIPAPEPTVRQVRLDVLPSSMIDAVELNKTLMANMDGNGIGGSVNIRTKTAGERPTLDAFVDGGYTNIMNGRASTAIGATAGNRFGVNKRLGLLVNGAFDYNGRGIDNFQPALDPFSTMAAPFYDSNTIREYRYYRYRDGFSGAADYKLNENTSFFANGIYSDLKDWGDKWYYKPVSQVLSATGVYSSKAAKAPAFYTSSKRPNASVGTIILGGRHVTDKSWMTFITSASYSYEVDSAGNPKADFVWIGSSLGNTCDYSLTGAADPYHPHFANCDNTASSPLLVASNWAFSDVTTSTGKDTQLNLTAAGSYARNYNLGKHFGTFEAGFKITNGHKTQDATETVYDGWATTSAAASGSTPYTMAALQSGFHNTDYFGGNYFGGNFGPVSDFNKVVDFTLANFAGDIDQYKTQTDKWPNLFHTIERIPAGYAMNTIDIGKLHMQAGLRFEDTQMDTSGYLIQFASGTVASGTSTTQPGVCPGGTITGNKNCYVVTPETNNPSYLDVLPSVQLRYALNSDSSLRAVYARGVSRPDPYQLVPYVTADDTANTAAIGNPSLKPEHANNYDLMYETSLHPLGMVQAGFFFKQLTAPQVDFQIPAGVNVAALPAGSIPASLLPAIENAQQEAGGTASVTQYINGQNAYLYGLELSYQQHLSFRAGFAYDGASLFSYGWISPTLAPGAGADPSNLGPTGPSGDVWTLAHYQTDAQASYRIWRGLSLKVVGLNLNNEVFGYYQGSTQFVNQREYYKPSYTGGLRYNFAQRK